MDMATVQDKIVDGAVTAGILVHSPMVLMLAIGLLGGWLSWLNTDYDSPYCHRKLARNLITGVLATFMVPLFLQMIGSSLLKDISPQYQQFYVFLGMCSAAAFVAQRFASTISEQLLQKANDKAEHAEQTAKNASEKTLSIEIQQMQLQGSLHMIKKNFEEALVYMDEYLKHNPKDSNTLWRRAYCLKRVGRVARALKDIDVAIDCSKKPQGMLYYNKGCYMALLKKDTSEIVKVLERALELDFEPVKTAIANDLESDFKRIKDDPKFIDFLSKYKVALDVTE